jgi:ATP-dependent Clp protease, protease subunit
LTGSHRPDVDATTELLLAQRILVLSGPIDTDITNRILAQMLWLSAEDPRADISLYIDSPGGSVPDAMAIHDTMAFLECDVATYAVGEASGMGQFLLSAGARGKRYALPHCHIRMCQVSAGAGGTASDVAVQQQFLERHKVETADLIASHTGRTAEQIMTDLDDNRSFTAAEALDYGLVDHVVQRVAQPHDAHRAPERPTATPQGDEAVVDLRWPGRTDDMQPPIGGHVRAATARDWTGYRIRFSDASERHPWTGAMVPLQAAGTFVTTVHARPDTLTEFHIELFDPHGTTVPVRPDTATYRHTSAEDR